MNHILDNEIETFPARLSENDDVNDSWDVKCNQYPSICKQFETFLEILYINLLNTVKRVHNGHRHLRFLKKVFTKAMRPARQNVPFVLV